VITLQNPHGLPPASVASGSASVKAVDTKAVAKPAAVTKLKAETPRQSCYDTDG